MALDSPNAYCSGISECPMDEIVDLLYCGTHCNTVWMRTRTKTKKMSKWTKSSDNGGTHRITSYIRCSESVCAGSCLQYALWSIKCALCVLCLRGFAQRSVAGGIMPLSRSSVSAFRNIVNMIFYASALPARGRECVYVLHMFFLFFFVFFLLFPSAKNMRQPFSGTAERIFMKLLPNDRGENGVRIAVPKWGPKIIFLGAKNWKMAMVAYSYELITPERKRISERLKRLWNHKAIYVRPDFWPWGKHSARFCVYKCKNSSFLAILSKFSAVTPQTFMINSPRGALQVWKIS